MFVAGASQDKVADPTEEFAITARVVVAEMLPAMADIMVVPEIIEVARPFEPAALLIAATDVLLELHVTEVVKV